MTPSACLNYSALPQKGLLITRNANRGSYIDLAAPGVDIWTANSGGEGVYLSGTSYATPFVVAALASYRDPRTNGFRVDIGQLGKYVDDLGDPGRDPMYGWGILRVDPGCK